MSLNRTFVFGTGFVPVSYKIPPSKLRKTTTQNAPVRETRGTAVPVKAKEFLNIP